MSEDYKVQASFKFGQGLENMVNVRADSAEELAQILDELKDQSSAIVDTALVFNSVNNLNAGGVRTAGNIDSQPAATTAAAATPAGHTCAHGNRVRRSGNKNGRQWVAYFCPLPKGTPGACDAVFE